MQKLNGHFKSIRRRLGMRNKVKNRFAYRLTAIFLVLVMTAGSFSVAVFAGDAGAEAPKSSAADEKTSVSTEKQEDKEKDQAPEEKKEDSSADKVAKSDTPADNADKEKNTDADASQKTSEDADANSNTEKSDSADSDVAASETPDKEEPTSEAPANTAAGSDEASAVTGAAPEKAAAPEALMAPKAANEAAKLNAPILGAVNAAIKLPQGVTASFINEDGKPDSWTNDDGFKGWYSIPEGSDVKLSMNTDAAKCEFSAAVDGGSSISMSNNSFKMPAGRVVVSNKLFYNVNVDLTGEDVPEGATATINGTTVSKGNSASILAETGDTVTVSATGAKECVLSAVNTKTKSSISIAGNSFTMPDAAVNLNVRFSLGSYNLNMDLTASDIPDGFYVKINGTKVSKGEKKAIKVEGGQKFKIEDIAKLTGVYYGTDRPSGTTLIKMRIGNSIIPVTALQGSGYEMPAADLSVAPYVSFRWKVTFTGDLHTCSFNNDTDRDSPWYGHAGDKIRINFDRASCRGPIEVTAKDASGKTVAESKVDSDSFTFTMPDSVATITIKGEYNRQLYNVTVRLARYGSLKVIDGAQHAEGLPVKVEAIPDEGYAINPAGILIAYKRNNLPYSIKAPTEGPGSNIFTFTMPSADVMISATFVKPHVVNLTSNKGGKITVDYKNPYGDYSSRGRDVYLKVTPKKGYVLKAWAARDAEGNKVDIDEDGCIVMPDSDVTVAAVFGKKNTGGGGNGGNNDGYISTGTESYYTGEELPEDGEEVDEKITPEELIDVLPLTSAIAAQTVLAVTSGINLLMR